MSQEEARFPGKLMTNHSVTCFSVNVHKDENMMVCLQSERFVKVSLIIIALFIFYCNLLILKHFVLLFCE